MHKSVLTRTETLAHHAQGPHDAHMKTDRVASRLNWAVLGVVAVVAALAAGPVLGVDPSRSGGPSAAASTMPQATTTPQPTKAPKPFKPAKAPKPVKVKTPESPITVRGTVTAGTDTDGAPAYTLAAGGTTYALEIGPSWWWGDKHPLAAYVGDRVTIVGERAEGATDIDVHTVDGTTVRTWTGKPPWAGGPKTVGERHPGWAAWHAEHPDGKPGKGQGSGNGRSDAPGQLKKAARAAAAAASASPTP